MSRGIGIFELVSDAQKLGLEAFEAKHGSYFLIRTLADGTLEPLAGFNRQTTAVIEADMLEKQQSRLENPEASYVYPVRPDRPGQAVKIGRASGSDIQVDDRSLSKTHAELFVRSDGSLAIIDRQSKNGSYLGGHRLEAGVPTVVQFGKTITFGGVRFTYLPVRQLVDFISVTFDHADWSPDMAAPPTEEVSDDAIQEVEDLEVIDVDGTVDVDMNFDD